MSLDLLEGVKVLDLSQWLPGPFAAQILSDLGADVVKVEPPAGDPMRRLGPIDGDGLSAFYKAVNAGKQVVFLDLKSEEGRAAFARLVAGADLLLESFRPGTLEKLGFPRERLEELNPGLVHTALSGYGQSGPYRLKAGHDLNYMAIGGGLASSGAEGRPVQAHPPTADYASALQAALASIAALFRKLRSGQGAFVDVSLMESVLGWQAIPLTGALRGEEMRPGSGLLNGGAAFYRIYETADGGFLTLGEIEPKFWANFCGAVGREDWIQRQGEPFPQSGLIAEVAELIASRPLDHWTALLSGVDVCAQPILPLAEVAADPQVESRGFLRESGGSEPLVEVLFTALLDGKGPGPRRPVRELGLSDLQRRWSL